MTDQPGDDACAWMKLNASGMMQLHPWMVAVAPLEFQFTQVKCVCACQSSNHKSNERGFEKRGRRKRGNRRREKEKGKEEEGSLHLMATHEKTFLLKLVK